MSAVAEIYDFAYDTIQLRDNDTKERVAKAVRTAHYNIMRAAPWDFARRTKSITTTEDDTEGTLMPSDMVAVIDPIKDSNDYLYFRTDPNRMPINGNQRYWNFDAGEVTPLLSKKGVTINQDASTFTLATGWTTAMIGEYVKFGKEQGAYLLTAEKSISTAAYRGPRLDNEWIQVRPPSTRRISLTDGQGDRLGATVIVNYWAYPEPLYMEWQEVPDYIFEPLKFLACMELIGFTADKKTGLYDKLSDRYVEALSLAKVRNPTAPMQNTPRDRTGAVRTFGRRG